MAEIKIHTQTKEQIKENREMLSEMLSSAEKIIDVASEEDLIAEFFGMSKLDFNILWYDIIELRAKIEGTISIRDATAEKDVPENGGN